VRNQPFSQFDEIHDDFALGANASRRRPFILTLFILICQIPIAARLVHVQAIISPRFVSPWTTPRVQTEPVPARDGRILSRDGVILAQDTVQYDISIDYRWLETPLNEHWLHRQARRELSSRDRKNAALRQTVETRLTAHHQQLRRDLAQVAGVPLREIEQNMARVQQRIETMQVSVQRRRDRAREQREDESIDWSGGFSAIVTGVMNELTRPPERRADGPLVLKEELQDHVILKNVPLQVAAAIQSQPARFLGIHVRSATSRDYPREDLAAHLVGLRRIPRSKTTATQITDAVPGQRLGESGIERTQQTHLQGQPGEVRYALDRHGERQHSEVSREPRDGHDVTLTIDSTLQSAAEHLLDQHVRTPLGAESQGARGGTVIAMDIWTGDLLILASSPRPSLSVLLQPTAVQWAQIQQDSRQPLFSRASQMTLPPGALFGLVTMLSALEAEAVMPDEILHCQGYLNDPQKYRCQLFRDSGLGHGQLLPEEALGRSCQVCFYELARRTGPEPLLHWSTQLGFGRLTGSDVPGEQAGRLPDVLPPANSRSRVTSGLLQLGAGQGAVLVSPLQVARLMALIANGGYLVTPRVIQTQKDPGSGTGSSVSPRQVPGLHPDTVQTLRRGLQLALSEPGGISQAAFTQTLDLAGLACTVPASDHPEHAWCAGFAPLRNPRFALVVALEQAGSTAPAIEIFHGVIAELLGTGELRPDQVTRP